MYFLFLLLFTAFSSKIPLTCLFSLIFKLFCFILDALKIIEKDASSIQIEHLLCCTSYLTKTMYNVCIFALFSSFFFFSFFVFIRFPLFFVIHSHPLIVIPGNKNVIHVGFRNGRFFFYFSSSLVWFFCSWYSLV